MKKSSKPLDYNNYVVDVKYTEKGGFKITLDMLEKLCKKADLAGKAPLLSLGIKRNEKEIFILNVTIHTEKK